jgi:hypothetical protein
MKQARARMETKARILTLNCELHILRFFIGYTPPIHSIQRL